MKLVTKIQSFSDVITNSSSTVFLMYEEDAKYWKKETPDDMCDITEITYQWLLDNHWEWVRYGDAILYHVLLPLMPSGRSSEGVAEGTFEYLEEMIEKNGIKNVAFGAHFIKDLRNSKIKTWLYDEQSFSKNVILTPNKVQITPSSFDLKPIKVIDL